MEAKIRNMAIRHEGKYQKWKEYARRTVGRASLTSGAGFPGGTP